MSGAVLRYSLPRWRLTRWLADAGPDVPPEIRVALIASLYGTLPIFIGGVVNSLAVSFLIAWRIPTLPFMLWCTFEVICCSIRLIVLVHARHRALRGAPTPTDLYLLLGVAWAAGIGAGTFLSLMSGDWVAATLACLSAAAMVGGICFRNFGAPRLAGTMILLSLGPIIPGAAFAGEPLFYIVYLQVPMYLAAMTAAAFRLNRMLITTMRAERENSHRAHHDALTGLLNRAGFVEALSARLGAHAERRFAVMFFDLDDFKPVNDTFGHAAGDEVLKAVAGRVRRALPDGAVVARMGGDEFVVLVDGVTAEMAQEAGYRLISEVAVSYELGGEVRAGVGASVGIAMSPDHGAEVEELLAVADAALYEAKSGGKSRCCLASVETNLAALRRLQQSGPKAPVASAA